MRFVAIAHAVGVKVTSPEAVNDLVLTIDKDGKTERVGPLTSVQDGGMFVFEHTLYMAEVSTGERRFMIPKKEVTPALN